MTISYHDDFLFVPGERGEEIEFQNKLKLNSIPKCVLEAGGVV